MRKITSHHIKDQNHGLEIVAGDEPNSGEANHRYQIIDVSKQNTAPDAADTTLVEINFQKGPILENGVNGVTNETLISIVIDRLESFQNGKLANRYNSAALHSLHSALASLKQRTIDRIERGVEGQTKE